MGEDVLIFVRKNQCAGLFFTAMKIEKLFGNRWYWFKDKFHLESYPDETLNYWTPEQILKEIAGKKVLEDYVNIIKDLLDKDCVIQGDYVDFPEDKNEDEYFELTGIFYRLWDKIRGFEKDKENPVIEGMKKFAMTKEAIASVALDKGQTQTFSEEDMKRPSKKNSKKENKKHPYKKVRK